MLKRAAFLRQWRIGLLQYQRVTVQSRLPKLGCPVASSRWAWRSRTYASVSAAQLQFGQPLHETHPHLLGPGERVYINLTRWPWSLEWMVVLIL